MNNQQVSKKNISKVKVSSVLNRDVKNYGKNNLFDGNPDSCWNSDEGKPQWVSVEFDEAFQISSFAVEFQGGFVGQNCQAIMYLDDEIDYYDQIHKQHFSMANCDPYGKRSRLSAFSQVENSYLFNLTNNYKLTRG